MRRIGLITLGLLLTAVLAWMGSAALKAEPAETGTPAGAAPEAGSIRAEGRLATYPGGSVTISAEVGGRIAQLPVEEGTRARRWPRPRPRCNWRSRMWSGIRVWPPHRSSPTRASTG